VLEHVALYAIQRYDLQPRALEEIEEDARRVD